MAVREPAAKQRTIAEDPRSVSGAVGKEAEAEEATEEKGYMGYVPYGITSFDQLDAYRNTQDQVREVYQLTDELHMLMQNVISSPDENSAAALDGLFKEFAARMKGAATKEAEEKSAIKREHGIDYPPADYAYVPDPATPSTWKIRLTEAPGQVTIAQLNRAAAQIQASGKSGVPGTALAAVKRRIRQEYRTLKVPENNIPAAVKAAFAIFKNADGQYRFLSVYSNCFRDDDGVPEIISSKSHTNFVEMVDEGVVSYPDLLHFHIPGTEWGKCDMVDFVDGFAIAGGYILPGHEKEAEAMQEAIDGGRDIRMSHGMPTDFIVRNAEDPTIIDFHVTTEISDLDYDKAANKLTDFTVLSKETNMPLSETKRAYLRDVAKFDDAKIAELEANLAGMAKAATAAGIESKEATPAAVEPVVEEETVEEEIPAEPAKSVTPAGDAPVTRAEIAEAFAVAIAPFQTENADLKERLAAAESEIKELRVANAGYQKAVEETTAPLSLAELMQMSVVGQKASRVDGRTKLANDGPVEAPAEEKPITGLSRVDSLIRNAQTQR